MLLIHWFQLYHSTSNSILSREEDGLPPSAPWRLKTALWDVILIKIFCLWIYCNTHPCCWCLGEVWVCWQTKACTCLYVYVCACAHTHTHTHTRTHTLSILHSPLYLTVLYYLYCSAPRVEERMTDRMAPPPQPPHRMWGSVVLTAHLAWTPSRCFMQRVPHAGWLGWRPLRATTFQLHPPIFTKLLSFFCGDTGLSFSSLFCEGIAFDKIPWHNKQPAFVTPCTTVVVLFSLVKSWISSHYWKHWIIISIQSTRLNWYPETISTAGV